MFLTEPVQVIALFSKELVTSCESVARFLTIADLDQSEHIETSHVLEALQYRVKV